jgi:hypothetical protein
LMIKLWKMIARRPGIFKVKRTHHCHSWRSVMDD